jgi:hypothetical protein
LWIGSGAYCRPNSVSTLHIDPLNDCGLSPQGVFYPVKALVAVHLTILVAAITGFAATSFAGKPAVQTSAREEKVVEQTVFITGSLIPQRIKLRPVGTTTFSPIRVIDRREIDQTGRRTTAGVLINEPSLRVIGH